MVGDIRTLICININSEGISLYVKQNNNQYRYVFFYYTQVTHMSLEANVMSIDVVVSDGVKYSTSEYEYHKKLRVGVLILKNVIEHEYRNCKKV